MLSRYLGKPVSGRLVYRRAEYSLDVEPKPTGGVASLLVNDIQIEVDEDGRLIFVWGLCPQESWTPATIEPPDAPVGLLRYSGLPVTPGVSKRLNAGKRWAVHHDSSNEWLCVGDQSSVGERVTFAPGAVATLSNGELTALWLRPEVTA
jgi:hypothetical protein